MSIYSDFIAHDKQTLQIDGINSDGGAFPFTTSGTVNFNKNISTVDPIIAQNATTKSYVDNAVDISAADVLITDSGTLFTATNVEAALEETGEILELANGSTLREVALTISSDGTTVTGSLSSSVGNTISFKFSGGVTDVDVTTPITTTLTAGTDTVPVINYPYVLASDPTTLVNNTTGFPTDVELFTCGKVICQSAASIQTDGCLKEHIFADMIANTVAGHVSHLSHWIRTQWATWISGVAPTFSGTGTGTISYGSTAGVVSQLHTKTFPQFLDGADIYCVNDPDTAYRKIINIGDLQKDSAGVSLTGKTYGLVFWGVLNDNGQSKIFVNLPSGSSNKEASARQDTDREINYSIPADFKGVGFLIYRLIIKNTGDASWTLYTGGTGDDLRGQFPATSAGSSTAIGIDFPDGASGFTLFNAADVTKEVQVDLSGITTGNTRTVTFPDSDITLVPKASPVFTGQATVPTINLTGGQIAFPATAVPSADPNTLDDYVELLTASTACTGAITTALAYTLLKVGRQVTLSVPQALGVGVPLTYIRFGVVLPAKYRPAATTYITAPRMRDNGADQAIPGMVQINANGDIIIFKDGTAGAYTTTAQAGFRVFCVTWLVAA